MARLYTDENFPAPAVEFLRESGHDVLAMVETEQAGLAIPDEQVLAFASQAERILLTLNRKHFIRLHNEDDEHGGIVVCTFDADFVALAERIHEVLEAHPDMTGRLVRVNRPPR